MSAESEKLLAEIVRFVHEIEREERRNPSGQIPPSDGFDGKWLVRWKRLIKRAELYLAKRPN